MDGHFDGSAHTTGSTALLDPPAEALPMRMELIRRVRRLIIEGTYETPEKMDAAVARLLDDLRTA